MSSENGRAPDTASELIFVGGFLAAGPEHRKLLERATEIVRPSDIRDTAVREVYLAALEVRRRAGAVDVELVRRELEHRETWHLVGFERLVEIHDWGQPSTIEEHARIVHEGGVRRRALEAARGAQLALEHSDKPTSEAVAEALRMMQQAAEEAVGGSAAFPAPESVLQILSAPVEEEDWLAEGLIPAGGNLLFVGPPKSLKTTGYMELAVAGATGTPFLHRYQVPRRFKTGIVLMEGVKRYAARRIERLALARRMSAQELDGWLYVWYRPPFRLDAPGAIHGLTEWVKKLELDVLFLDPWMSIRGAEADSNHQDDVRPQLDAYAAMRDACPGLTTQLTVHAGKMADGKGRKITDQILGSTAFGAWFDCALAFERKDESSPVSVRTEYKDLPSLAPFTIKAEDQEPALERNGWTPQGWYSITVGNETPVEAEQRSKAEVLVPAIIAFLETNSGCSVNELRRGVDGDNRTKDAAIRLLQERAKVYVEKAEKRGLPDRIFLAGGYVT